MHAALGILLLFISLHQAANGEGHCVMRGKCATDYLTERPKPCHYNGTALPLNDESSVKFLKEVCPSLTKDEDFKVCCDSSQVNELEMSLESLASLFKRCPSCYHNIAEFFCHLTCSPTQSDFLKVTGLTLTYEDKVAINSIDYYISENLVKGIFDSCSEVKLGETSLKAIAVTCGSHGADCTPHKWFEYLGGNDPSPFQIDFKFGKTDTVVVGKHVFHPMNATVVPCNKPVTPGGAPCSCKDCNMQDCNP